MIVIGVDTHKRTHALAAVDADTGQGLGEREIAATEQGHLEGLRWAHELGHEITWAVEHVSQRFERSLVAAGERVLRVAPKLMGASRRGEREPGKSDQIDARATASSATSHATTTASSVLHRLTPAPQGSYLLSALIAAIGTLFQKRFSSLKAPQTAVILRCAPVVLRHLGGGYEEGTCQLPDRLRKLEMIA